MGSGTKRLTYIDILNVLSACAVIIMHVNLAYWAYRPAPSWILNTIIFKTFEWAVQVFYMITGATLIGYTDRMSTLEYAKRRIRHTVVPFVVWSGVVLAVDIFVFKLIPLNLSISSYINSVLNTSLPLGNAYWFFIPLFSIYLCILVLTKIEKSKRIRIFTYLIAVYLIIKIGAGALGSLGLKVSEDLTMPMAAGWMIYPLAGYVISNRTFSSIEKRVVYFLGIAGWLTMLSGTIILSYQSGQTAHAYSAGMDWPKFFQAAAVFLFFKEKTENNQICDNRKIWRKCSELTFGTYLIHMMVIQAVLSLFNINNQSWWWAILGIPAVIAISVLIVSILKKIPYVNTLV